MTSIPAAAGEMGEHEPADLEVFAQELSQEIASDPPIRCSIEFHWGGSQELAEQVSITLTIQAALLRRQAPGLDFSGLKKITFHGDYDAGLRDASAKVARDLIPTRESGGLSVAMVVHNKDGCELVVDARLAMGLLSDDDAQRDGHINTLRHELCHVDDFRRKQQVWADEFLVRRLNGLRSYFFPMADSLWSEYYANRVSDGPCADSIIGPEEDMLIAAIRDAQSEISLEIMTYRSSHDLAPLRELAVRKVSFVSMAMGYVLGHWSSRRKDLGASDAVLSVLESLDLLTSFVAIRTELERLFENRQHWTSVDELRKLEQLLVDVMGVFGLYFEDHGNGLVFIRVPFS